MAVTFEGYERRVEKINKCLAENGIASLEEALQICTDKGFNPREIVHNTQSIAFQNAEWAYTLGCALAIKKGAKDASEAASIIGEGIQAFTVPGSVAEDRKVGLGHGNLGAMLLSDDTECFAFLAGHESFAAAEGAIGLALNANKARKKPLRVILNGLGKDAAQIIARINGFTYVKTQFDYAGTYKKERLEAGKKYFSVASGGGTGRTLHPDNMGAGPASYGMTDTMGRMHSDAQFAGSSSVPAHVDMMGLIGMGNNPMVGATVACAVAVDAALNK